MSKVAYTVGRFQPPTIGHQMLIRKTIEAAGPGGHAYVFVSKTVDNDKSPLPIKLKLPILQHMFPEEKVKEESELATFKIIDTSECTPACGGPGAAFKWLRKEHPSDEIVFVIGKERLDDQRSKEYFGPEARLWGTEERPKDENFLPVGDSAVRDMTKPSDDEMNMSGTKARGYACANNRRDFNIALGYPPDSNDDAVTKVYNKIREVKCPSTGGDPLSGVKRQRDWEVETPTAKRSRTDDEEGPIPTGGPDGEPNTGGRRRKSRFVESKRIRRSKRRKTVRRLR
jgi:hypothetical protein